MVARCHTLAEWLTWQESHHPNAIDLGLDRVKTVAERLGVLNPKARIITIAGTNGKGSCVAALEALLAASGKTFGAYTSPHFLHYNERIRLAGQPVSDAKLCEAFTRIDHARGDISLTYFEFGTLAAMDIFHREPLDYWLMEIGLGGRLDAVNIIAPHVAVLTSIAIDHEAWLGHTREQIGREKVGICRSGIDFVCAEPDPPHSVVAHANALNCNSVWLGQDYRLDDVSVNGESQQHVVTSRAQTFNLHSVSLPKASVAAAIEVCLLERCLPQDPVGILAQATLTGRMQFVSLPRGRLLLDVAHNPASAQLLADELKRKHFDALPATVAMMADKDIAEILAPLQGQVSHWYCADLVNNARAAKATDIADVLATLGVPTSAITCVESVEHSVMQWQSSSEADECLLVFGSFFTVAAALEHYG
ncbi:bifunctional folylpolyglutamate synthase/dihydrofolate synthase [Marinagarivorans algicola]|uniref:bifunctional folylpolyglutamate synthase/dihydrofolate synthase n=1 Tax=Marinagarivorans algicola TaxID=1513270 RepID=UPI0006B4BFAB|nr:Mur ligase family protein [Marinagarivorans algicola]